jgi:predicted Zn-dependent protease
MINGIETIEGVYFDGHKPIGRQITFSISNHEVMVTELDAATKYPLSQIRVSPRIGGAERFISLPDGGQILCLDHTCLNLLLSDSPTETVVTWLERRHCVAVACVLIILASVSAGYHFGLPAAANWAVTKVSMATERSLGEDAFRWLDKRRSFEKSQLDEWRRQCTQLILSKLVKGLKHEACYRLEFRHSEKIGPNAMALPGGIIVVTDEMVWEAGSEDEFAAVLAHEIGHVELQHGLKEVMENSALAVAAGFVTQDASSFTAAVADLPALLARTKYSRNHEIEADDFACNLLKKHCIPPAALASLLERISNDYGEGDSSLSFASTHPVTAERIKRARQAGK